MDQVPGGEYPCTVSLWTVYEDAGLEAQVPRDLIIEVKGEGSSLDETVSSYQQVAQGFANFTAFVANAAVDQTRLHLAFDASPDRHEHEFLQLFSPSGHEVLANGRMVEEPELGAFLQAGLPHADWTRLARAIGHYSTALSYWYYGGETLALAHLYMAAEGLTPAVVRASLSSRGLQHDDHAKLADELGIKRESGLPCPNCGHAEPAKWRMKLEQWHRRNIIFRGDNDTYSKARQASDSLEHGFGELAQIRAYAVEVVDKTFSYIRGAILSIIPLDGQLKAEMQNRRPVDIRSPRRMIRARFIGEANRLPAEGEPYPYLGWRSSIRALAENPDGSLRAEFEEQMTVHCGAGIEFRAEAFELRGRLEAEKDHIQIRSEEGATEPQAAPANEVEEDQPTE
jgi:hypothetical protein